MDIVIKAIQFFLCFTLLVGLHEFGHFLIARLFKIRVEKFYIFFDLGFSLFKFNYKGTEYGLGWLPLGGYVKIAGMIDESMDKEQMKQPVKSDEFRAKPAWQRFLVMIAGVTMNILLAIFIYCGVCYTWGDSYFSNQDAKWGYNYNAQAQALGFVNGDQILSIDGQQIDNVISIVNDLIITEGDRKVVVKRNGIETTLDLRLNDLIELRKNKGYEDFLSLRVPFLIDSVTSPAALAAGFQKGDQVVGFNGAHMINYATYQDSLIQNKNKEVTFTLLNNQIERQATVTLDENGMIGVRVQSPYQLRTQEYTFAQSIPAGLKKTGSVISNYWQQLKLIVQPKTKMYQELGGFVAIGNIFPSQWDWQDFWLKTAFLSIILAIMNLLPIPGLDGGHALFTLWEIITGRKVNDKILEAAQYVGLVFLLGLLIYANGNDIYRFFIQ
ncbi:MAG: RIP metalloprotease RseP [Alistipes sp.]